MPPQLVNVPPLPEHAAYLWRWYQELRGNAALTFAEIQAWAGITGRRVTGEEALALRSLDTLFRNQLTASWKTSQS